ncbi:MAG: transcription repressor NadR [Lachnospiraceae bacterium]|nr:transcription repressor NadR [Lachnospiraceae bacterium]
MDGEQRRNRILELLHTSKEPISGTTFAKTLQVSRQVIVQDIALLRAINKNILSTNKGYIVYGQNDVEMFRKTVAVKHTDNQIQEELYAIVDAGGKVLDVVIEHEIYGQIAVDLVICSRKDVDEFVENILKCKTKPLKLLTDDIHYHTIEAKEESVLKQITESLREKGYLILTK